MLATMAAPQYPLQTRELDVHQTVRELTEVLDLDDRVCPGCKQSLMNYDRMHEQNLVVAFGQSYFHVDCFRCAKCNDKVTADTNLLLLSDGSPVCTNCSYICNVCHQAILDEAIMTGDDSFHAHCFKCKICKNRIDELVFAKTSQGIYCMKCHNERMIKIRKKKARERNGGTGSSKARDHESRHYQHENTSALELDSIPHLASSRSTGTLSAGIQRDASYPNAVRSPDSATYTRPSSKPKGPPQAYNGLDRNQLREHSSHASLNSLHTPSTSTLTTPRASPSTQTLSVTVAPPDTDGSSFSVAERSVPTKFSTLPIPPASNSADERRHSYDDGVRPLNVLFNHNRRPSTANPTMRADYGSGSSEGLTVTPKPMKRRSINPGLVLPNPSAARTLSPQTATFPGRRLHSPTTPLSARSWEYPRPELQRQGGHQSGQASQASSQRSSLHSYHSFTSDNDTRAHSQSPPVNMADTEGQTIIFSSPRNKSYDSTPTSAKPKDTLSLSDINERPLEQTNRLSSNSSLIEGGSRVSSRSGSPYHRVDVPRSIEDGSDSDAAGEAASPLPNERQSPPPVPPPKDIDEPEAVTPPSGAADVDIFANSSHEMSDDMSELSPVEKRTSHATFIAPALPPIRFSLSAGDFSELLSSVQGVPGLKPLDHMAKFLKDSEDAPSVSPTSTPTSATGTMMPPIDEEKGLEPSAKETRVVSPERISSRPKQERSPSVKSPPASRPQSPPEGGSSPNQSQASFTSATLITVTDVNSGETTAAVKDDNSNCLPDRLREMLKDAQGRGAQQVWLNCDLLEAIVTTLDTRAAAYRELKERFDGMKRKSQHVMDGLTVAQAEYDNEVKARRDAEAEVTRLRVLLSGQAARLTALSSDDRRQELRQQLSKELNDNLSGLEHDLSRLKLERDITLAEMEEMSNTKSSASGDKSSLGRSLTRRLDGLKRQYQRELIPLTEQREVLSREIAELKAIRDAFLEETTALNARNEELAQLSHIYSRRLEAIPESTLKNAEGPSVSAAHNPVEKLKLNGHAQAHSIVVAPSLSSSISGSSVTHEESQHIKTPKSEMDIHITPRKFKWMGGRTREAPSFAPLHDNSRGRGQIEHNFLQVSVLRFTRCDHCSEKLWGSQFRCTVCNMSIHMRCVAGISTPCAQQLREDAQGPLPPSMFGRQLIEQVQADDRGDDRQVPVIVEKCIAAVEAIALDYEGIYRKTGGSSQSKLITQLFERGDYTAFDLLDSDRFNDICSVTSVLKTYFRSLPNPLLTFELYEQFVKGVTIKDPTAKNRNLSESIRQLPSEHYYTLKMLMLHLNRVHERNEKNLMTARNLGVVFGPTLIRSRDPTAEFSDMAERALFVEWLIENAPRLFSNAT